MRELLDINSNGALGPPDALAWLFFATVGLLGLAVCVGMAAGTVVAIGRGSWWVLRRGGRLLSGTDGGTVKERRR